MDELLASLFGAIAKRQCSALQLAECLSVAQIVHWPVQNAAI